MRRIFTILTLALLPFLVNAQDTIVAWTFPSTSADSMVDAYISLNSSRYISCQTGTWGAPSYSGRLTDYTTNGSLGSPDKCAKAVAWNNQADSMYWMVKFKTTAYGNLKLYSKQQSGGSNPGPRDFLVQYKLSGTTTWNNLDTLVCANDWTTGAVNGLVLPIACENSSSNVSIRWLVTSVFDINGDTILSTGINKIDDIVVTGTAITGIDVLETESFVSIYPNPNKGNFIVENNGEINKIEVYNILGKRVYVNENTIEPKTELSGFISGMYIVQITSALNKVYNYKIVVE
jgi:hypothetical protein